MSNNGRRRIAGYDPQTGAPIYSTTSGGGKKAVKFLLIALIVAALGAAGWFAYNTFAGASEVDLTSNMSEISVYGYSGEGVLDDGTGMYYDGPQIGKGDVQSFYDSIVYTADKTEGLSNGDKITVTANYDKAAAKKCRIKVTNATRTFVVSDLRERYLPDLSDMTEVDRSAIIPRMDECAEEYAEGRGWKDFDTSDLTDLLFISRGSTSGEGKSIYYNDTLVAVYKCTYKDPAGNTATANVVVQMYPLERSFDYEDDIEKLLKSGRLIAYAYSDSGDHEKVIRRIKDETKSDDVVTDIEF